MPGHVRLFWGTGNPEFIRADREEIEDLGAVLGVCSDDSNPMLRQLSGHAKRRPKAAAVRELAAAFRVPSTTRCGQSLSQSRQSKLLTSQAGGYWSARVNRQCRAVGVNIPNPDVYGVLWI